METKYKLTFDKIKILEVWEKDIFEEFSRAEIMEKIGKKTKTWIFNNLKLLASYKILNSKRKGNMDIYQFNLDNPLAFKFLDYLEAIQNLNFPELDIISEIIKKVPVKDYCLVVFGSHAAGEQTNGSDLDIAFLIKDKETKKKITPYLNELKLDFKKNIDEHYITFSEFVEMLLRDEENLAKQIFKKHKTFYNSDIYYQLIKEAHKSGFRQ